MGVRLKELSEKQAQERFGRFIRNIRTRKGMTLKFVSEKSGINKSHLSTIENGHNKPYKNKEKLEKLALALKIREDSNNWHKFFDFASLCRKEENGKVEKEERIEPVEIEIKEDVTKGKAMINPQQRMEDLRILLNKIENLRNLRSSLKEVVSVNSIHIWGKIENLGDRETSIKLIGEEKAEDIFEIIVQAVPMLIDRFKSDVQEIIKELK